MSSFHLDTDYLINFLGSPVTPEGRHASQVVNRLLYKGYDVRASLLTIGEAVKVCCDQPARVDLEALKDQILRKRVAIYRPEPADLPRLASMLRAAQETVWGVGSMDIMHLAHALTDETAAGFLTFDFKVSSNKGIAELKKNGFLRERFVIGSDSGV